jgi:hypothetical protein
MTRPPHGPTDPEEAQRAARPVRRGLRDVGGQRSGGRPGWKWMRGLHSQDAIDVARDLIRVYAREELVVLAPDFVANGPKRWPLLGVRCLAELHNSPSAFRNSINPRPSTSSF